MYKYNAKMLKVVDGDTVDMEIDMGFNVKIKQRLRLYGINAPELRSKDNEEVIRAKQAKSLIEQHLIVGQNYVIDTYKEDKYGRLLAVVYLDSKLFEESTTINTLLVTTGNAEIYKK